MRYASALGSIFNPSKPKEFELLYIYTHKNLCEEKKLLKKELCKWL